MMTVALLAGSVSYGANLAYVSSTESNWFTVANWQLENNTGNLANRLPTASDTVRILSNWAQAGVSVTAPGAVSGQVRLGLWGSGARLTVEAAGTLSAASVSMDSPGEAQPVAIINHGEFDASGVIYVNGGATTISNTGTFACGGLNPGDTNMTSFTVYNTGDMDITAGWLYLATATGTNCTFNMLGGTLDVADKITMKEGGSARLNLYGGTITTDRMDVQANGDYTIDVRGDGTLVVSGNQTVGLNNMIGLGLITASDEGFMVVASYDGTNTTMRAVHAGVIDVTSYGATPDDGVDDTAGIQAALDAADAYAGVDEVYLPAGDYQVDMLRIGSDVIFRGEGSHGGSVTRLQMNDHMPGASNILRNKNTESGDSNITIEKICFDGRKASQTNAWLHLVRMMNVVGLRVDDCEFHNSQAIGCAVAGDLAVDSRTEVLNCYATGNELGFYAQSTGQLIDGLNGLVYSNCSAVANGWGFDVYLASNILYSSCVASSNVNGHGSGFTSDSCVNLTYTNCLAEHNEERGFAVYINTNKLRQPGDVFFIDCDAGYNGISGFKIENARDVSLSNVRAYGNGENGIRALSSAANEYPTTGLSIDNAQVWSNGTHGVLLWGVRNSEILSSSIYDNSLTSTGIYSGVYISDGVYNVPDMPSTNILIRNNDIGGAAQAYGVESVGLVDFVTLQDNDLSGNQIAPTSLVGSNNSFITSPNVVLIMADDMGWRDLGCYGSEFYETPNIDQLCSEGLAFTDAYASAPLCSATRAALLTGWAPARQHLHGVTPNTRDESTHDYASWTDPAVMKTPLAFPITVPEGQGQLPLSSITIAERLKEVGYATGFFGKWHLGPDDDKMASHQGFDVAIADDHLGWPKSYFSPYQNPHLTDGPVGEQLTDRLAAEACTFISNSVAASSPFFCYVPTFAVHGPWDAKQEYIDYFTGTRNETNAQNFAVYAGMVKSLDDAVGTIVAELKAQGVYENTIIIFTSDNGGIRMEKPDKTDGNKIITSMRPLRGQKTTTYEGGLRVPTIVRWPGVASRESDEVIITHDLYPTILAAAGLEKRADNPLDGINLKSFIIDETPTGREAVTWFFPAYTLFGQPEWNRSGAVIRKGKWKLRHFWDGTNNPAQPWPCELYDLEADIGETTNLAGQYPEKVTELEALLMTELTAQNAHIPVANPSYDEARYFSLWDEQKAAADHLWSTQQGTPIEWLEDYELVDGFNWHAADWKDAGGVRAWQAYDAGALPVPFRMEGAFSGNQLDLRHPVRSTYRYAIMATETLTDPDWQEVTNETATANGYMELSLPIGDETNRFYAIRETVGAISAVPILLNLGDSTRNLVDTDALGLGINANDYSGLPNTGTTNEATLVYDLSGQGIGGGAHTLEVAIAGNGYLTGASGNGIAVGGGSNDAWFDVGETLSFGFTIKNEGGDDITDQLNFSFTGFSARGRDNTADGTNVTITVGGQVLSSFSTSVTYGIKTGFTNDIPDSTTTIDATRSGQDNILQLSQMQFEIVP